MSARVSLRTVFHRALQAEPEPVLLILLPGFDMHAEDFVTHGFIEAAQAYAPFVDILVAEPDLDLYLDGTIGAQLAALIPAKDAGCYAQTWLAGISLGCFGALLAAAPPAAVEGLILLAPFLGTPGLIAEIDRAGGLAKWEAGVIAANDHERRLLARLKHYGGGPETWPILHLGYGKSDRFSAASRLLAALLPQDRVYEIEGAHDWPSWRLLWRRILAADPLSLAMRPGR